MILYILVYQHVMAGYLGLVGWNIQRSVGEHVAKELPVDARARRRVPMEVQRHRQRRDPRLQEHRRRRRL